MTKHEALRDLLGREHHALLKRYHDTHAHIEQLQQEAYEIERELGLFPHPEELHDLPYQELASRAEDVAGCYVEVPDILFADDEDDDGTEEIAADQL